MDNRGALIVVEGLDRAGKTTQVELLCKNLQVKGHKAEYKRFPDRTTQVGRLIDSYLKSHTNSSDHAIHLLFSANRWEAADEIRSKLESGTTLIIDRYSYSGAVYSTAKQTPLLDLVWAWAPEIGLPQPDLVIFLTIAPEEARKRGGYGDERYETSSMQERVRCLFDELLVRVPGSVQRLDAGRALEEVEVDMLRISEDTISSLKTPIPVSIKTLGHLRPGKKEFFPE